MKELLKLAIDKGFLLSQLDESDELYFVDS